MTAVAWGDSRDFLDRRLLPRHVVVPVHYDPVADEEAAWEAIGFNRTTPLPQMSPTIPPGTVSLPRKHPHTGRRLAPVLHVLSLDADPWQAWTRAALTDARRGHLRRGEFLDHHTDVQWEVQIDPDGGTWRTIAFRAVPVTPYVVHLPLDPARSAEARAMVEDRYLTQLRPKVSL